MDTDIKAKIQDLEKQLSDPSVFADQVKFNQINDEYAQLKGIYDTEHKISELKIQLEEILEMKNSPDSEIAELAIEEEAGVTEQIATLEKHVKALKSPVDPGDKKNAILEIRAGAGGEEAALFAQDLLRMYLRYAETKGWKAEMMSTAYAGQGGMKEVIVNLQGKGVYGELKYESGVHRVQRVPSTETAGRIHTSAASVAILAEVDDVEVVVDHSDLKIDVYRSSGPGGQSVNTTDSAVRITHLPTGLVVTCQDGKNQHKNKDQAMKVLKSRLWQIEQDKAQEALDTKRKQAISTGDRSAKIRTYNYPQDRVTDHRIKQSWFGIQKITDGSIAEIINDVKIGLYDQGEGEK